MNDDTYLKELSNRCFFVSKSWTVSIEKGEKMWYKYRSSAKKIKGCVKNE